VLLPDLAKAASLWVLKAAFLLFFVNLLVAPITERNPPSLFPQQAVPQAPDSAVQHAERLIREVIKDSYPELANADVRVQTFSSKSDYFRTTFSYQRFLFGLKMRYFIKVNPRFAELNAPESGIRAILAHELGHVYDFQRRNRLQLFSLLRLASKGYTARFERWTDLQAIQRGYSEGLKAYRLWLYDHIPASSLAEKHRNYFSPEEIDLLQAKLKQNPALMKRWLNHVPMNLKEIEATH
jgi:hypothetical protein